MSISHRPWNVALLHTFYTLRVLLSEHLDPAGLDRFFQGDIQRCVGASASEVEAEYFDLVSRTLRGSTL